MKSTLAAALLSLAVLKGCDFGPQAGKFEVSGMRSVSLDGSTGKLVVVRGYATPLLANPGEPTPLLFVLVLVPDFKATGGGGSMSNLEQIVTVGWQWSNDDQRIDGELKWDRQSEEVAVGGAKFNRERGNAFVVIRNKNGRWEASQVSVKNSTTSDSEALKQIQETLPGDSPAKSVKLYKSADTDS